MRGVQRHSWHPFWPPACCMYPHQQPRRLSQMWLAVRLKGDRQHRLEGAGRCYLKSSSLSESMNARWTAAARPGAGRAAAGAAATLGRCLGRAGSASLLPGGGAARGASPPTEFSFAGAAGGGGGSGSADLGAGAACGAAAAFGAAGAAGLGATAGCIAGRSAPRRAPRPPPPPPAAAAAAPSGASGGSGSIALPSTSKLNTKVTWSLPMRCMTCRGARVVASAGVGWCSCEACLRGTRT